MLTRLLRFDAESARRVSNMLAIEDRDLGEGQPIPQGWHFPLLGAETLRADLRDDGFPGLGVPMPELGLRRTVAAGRKARFGEPICLGSPLIRKSEITSVLQKSGSAGAMAIITVAHELSNVAAPADRPPAIFEEQTYILLEAPYLERSEEVPADAPAGTLIQTVTPDETFLFQFSALSFNSHKIHLDRSFARDVEGYPDLVVNGGIVTLLMTEILRNELSRTISSYSLRNKAPLFCNHPIRFVANETQSGMRLIALDHKGRVAAEMEATFDVQ